MREGETTVPEESASTPKQGLGVWIMSGSLALVLLIGGAVAFTSANKSSEEGNPTATQTVAPGGGHTTAPTFSPAPRASDPTAGPGTSGVLEEQQTRSGTDDDGSAAEARPQSSAPVVPGRDPARFIRQQPRAQTPSSDPRAPEAERTEPGSGPAEPGVPGEPRTAEPGPMAPDGRGGGQPGPVAPGSEFTPADASWSETGEELRIGFAVPRRPGSYILTVSVDGQQFTVRVRVGEQGEVTVAPRQGLRNPYQYDPGTGRLSGVFVPADFGQPVFRSGSAVTTSSHAGSTTRSEAIPVAESRSAPARPSSPTTVNRPPAAPELDAAEGWGHRREAYAENRPRIDDGTHPTRGVAERRAESRRGSEPKQGTRAKERVPAETRPILDKQPNTHKRPNNHTRQNTHKRPDHYTGPSAHEHPNDHTRPDAEEFANTQARPNTEKRRSSEKRSNTNRPGAPAGHSHRATTSESDSGEGARQSRYSRHDPGAVGTTRPGADMPRRSTGR